ncbi:MAG TPA: hypothetical protein VGG32_10560, partial [Thermoplasmata archaeon]
TKKPAPCKAQTRAKSVKPLPDIRAALTKMGVCDSGKEHAVALGWERFWQESDHPEWMLWLAARLPGIDLKLIVRAAVEYGTIACREAEGVLKHVPDSEDRPRKAIETARETLAVVLRWTHGEATREEAYAAAYAAAAAANAAANAAAYAAAAAAAADAADAHAAFQRGNARWKKEHP